MGMVDRKVQGNDRLGFKMNMDRQISTEELKTMAQEKETESFINNLIRRKKMKQEKRFYSRPMGGWDRQEEIVNPSDGEIREFLNGLDMTADCCYKISIFGKNNNPNYYNADIVFPAHRILIAISPTCGTLIANYIPEQIACDSTIIIGRLKEPESALRVRREIDAVAVLDYSEYEYFRKGGKVNKEITLNDLSKIGLEENSHTDTMSYYRNWKDSDAPVFASEEKAKEENPDVFSFKAKTKYKYADWIRRTFYLKNGERVVKCGWDWSEPSPGSSIVYYKEN
jgi:hypothetical protein